MPRLDEPPLHPALLPEARQPGDVDRNGRTSFCHDGKNTEVGEGSQFRFHTDPPRLREGRPATAACAERPERDVRMLKRVVCVSSRLIPPSTVRFAPVMYEDSGPATKDTNAATSSTRPNRSSA